MMTHDYGVRVIRAYENKRVGQVIFPPGLLRSQLVKGGWVEPVEAPPSRVAAAARAIVAPVIKRGGK